MLSLTTRPPSLPPTSHPYSPNPHPYPGSPHSYPPQPPSLLWTLHLYLPTPHLYPPAPHPYPQSSYSPFSCPTPFLVPPFFPFSVSLLSCCGCGCVGVCVFFNYRLILLGNYKQKHLFVSQHLMWRHVGKIEVGGVWSSF